MKNPELVMKSEERVGMTSRTPDTEVFALMNTYFMLLPIHSQKIKTRNLEKFLGFIAATKESNQNLIRYLYLENNNLVQEQRLNWKMTPNLFD